MSKKIINIKQLPLHLQKDIKAEVAGLNLKPKRSVLSNVELSKEAQKWLKKVVEGTWTQRSDGKIDVDGHVIAGSDNHLHRFMGKEIFFGDVRGGFYCSHTRITSLKGAPEKVEQGFDCTGTNITSLEGAPREVSEYFDCGHTNITSLEGAPEKVDRDFYCGQTNITSLKGAPKEVSGDFDCGHTNITSLEGAPREVGGHFNCTNTNIASLKAAPEKVGGYFDCSDNPNLTSLEGAPRVIGRGFDCKRTNITSLDGIGTVKHTIDYRETPLYYKELNKSTEFHEAVKELVRYMRAHSVDLEEIAELLLDSLSIDEVQTSIHKMRERGIKGRRAPVY